METKRLCSCLTVDVQLNGCHSAAFLNCFLFIGFASQKSYQDKIMNCLGIAEHNLECDIFLSFTTMTIQL